MRAISSALRRAVAGRVETRRRDVVEGEPAAAAIEAAQHRDFARAERTVAVVQEGDLGVHGCPRLAGGRGKKAEVRSM